MPIFDIGIKILFFGMVVFFLVFSYACYLWSGIHKKKERIIIATTVPLLYSFLFFFIGVITLGLIHLGLKYFPGLFETLF